MGFRIIQGGMGVGVSGWRLARAVSELGELGVVSGTGLAVVLARRLEMGDAGGHMRRALAAFPVRDMAQRILQRHYIEGGKAKGAAFKPVGMPAVESRKSLIELTVMANFAEVWLAKEGHGGVVGINYLEKMQIPTLPSLLGAMMAGVDYVLMGAGIPRSIPGILDGLAEGRAVELKLDVADARDEDHFACKLDPAEVLGIVPKLRRPRFLAIISSVVLAMTLARKSNGRVDGFVVEGRVAGGHNAPPRGPMKLTAEGEPVYGERDEVELAKLKEVGLPFWLAGGFGRKGGLKEALAAGAQGIQVGTAFAFCEESGIDEVFKRRVVEMSIEGEAGVFTDPRASPTGFPFKVVKLQGTLADRALYEARERSCNLGYLRQLYRREDGAVRYRCAAEAQNVYIAKGGKAQETEGRMCLCNGLFATIGLGQVTQDGANELAVVTAGDEVGKVAEFLRKGEHAFTARDVVERLQR